MALQNMFQQQQPLVARNPNTPSNYAIPQWNDTPSRFKYDVQSKNDPFGFRQAGLTFGDAFSKQFGSTLNPASEMDNGPAYSQSQFRFDPYSGQFLGLGNNSKQFSSFNSDPSSYLSKTPELQNLYNDYQNKFNTWKSSQTSSNLAQELKPITQGYGELSNLVGNLDSALNKINSNMYRYGINSLSDIGSRTGANGKPEYYKKATGELLPDQFGHFKSDSHGTLRVKLDTDANGNVTLKNDFENPHKQFDDYMGDVVLASVLAMAGGAAGMAAGGGGAAAGAGEGAAAGSTAGTSAGAYGGYAGTELGSGLSSAGSSFGAGLGDLASGLSASTSGATIGTGLGELGSGTSFLGSMGGVEGLGLGSGGWSLGTLKDMYDAASTANKVYNATTGGGQSSGGGQQGASMGDQNVLPLLASLYNTFGNNTADKMQDISKAALERGDPFGPQRAGYAQKLAETYTNPQAVYDNNYSALDKTFFNQLMAQDAARGRSTDSYKRGVEREAKFQDWMNNYRSQLGGFAGANIDPSRMAGEYLSSMNNAALLNNYNNQSLFAGLGQMTGSNGNGGLSLNDIISGGKTLYNTGSDLWDWGSSFFGE